MDQSHIEIRFQTQVVTQETLLARLIETTLQTIDSGILEFALGRTSTEIRLMAQAAVWQWPLPRVVRDPIGTKITHVFRQPRPEAAPIIRPFQHV